MSKSLLDLKSDDKARITVRNVITGDMIPWFISGSLSMLIFVGLVLLLSSTGNTSDTNFINSSAVLYTRGLLLYIALIAMACVLARRSIDKWTWILTAILVFFFVPQGTATIAVDILPNSILPAAIAMLGLLSAGRVFEYIQTRRINPHVIDSSSDVAVIPYVIVAITAFVLTSSIFA